MKVRICFEQDATKTVAQKSGDCVWVIESPANRAAAEVRWTEQSYGGDEVTVFDSQRLANLIPTVLEHHPDCENLEVHGVKVDQDAWVELRRQDFVLLDESHGVVRVRRQRDTV